MTMDELWQEGVRYKIQQKQEEFCALLGQLQRESAETIVDIGCYDGGTTICFAHLSKRLISCDLKRRFELEEIKRLCAYDFVEANSHADATLQRVRELLAGRPVDALFIDGDHTEAGAYRDYIMYRPLVRVGGLIAFHDIIDSEMHRNLNCFVSRAWERIKPEHADWREIVCGELTWGGIGVVRMEERHRERTLPAT